MSIRSQPIDVVLLVVLAWLSGVTGQAQVVNLDVEGAGGVVYSGQGAHADPGNDFWNSSDGGMTDLVASDGVTPTTVDVAISVGGRFDYTLSHDLMRDYSYSRDADTTVTISGLAPYGSYLLYVYCQGDQLSQAATVTFGGTVLSTTGNTSGHLVEGGNYVAMVATADASGQIAGTVARNGSRYAAVNGLQIVPYNSGQARVLLHPGMSHKASDLERMKYMVEAEIDPWYTSYQNLCSKPQARYDYAVQGHPTNTVVYRNAPYTNKSAWENDSRAAYYNALRWCIEGDTRHADKAVECFNVWTNLTYVQHGGTEALSGSMVYIILEAAELIKSTYPGWSAQEIQHFSDMLVYPGYSNTSIPSDLTTQGTWYWRTYKFEPIRAGNQDLSAIRAVMAMGIFLDNEIIYDRAYRYVSGMSHRPDDLSYAPGPNSINYMTDSNEYRIAYNVTQGSAIPDYGFNGVVTNYVWETGQCQESSRDQGHTSWGLGLLCALGEMAWNQGDDLWGHTDSRVLLGLEYTLRYNLSYLQPYPDQPAPWEPTPASGEFMQGFDRTMRTYSLKICPYVDTDTNRLTRGNTPGQNVWELPAAHYIGRGFKDGSTEAKWTARGRDYSIEANGTYEQADSGGAYLGYGGLTFRRPAYCYGDPISALTSNGPVYAIHQLPGTIEAELYDDSLANGEGRTYHDLSPGNSGGAFRSNDVDIAVCSEGGYALIDLEDGEWVSFTVHVADRGKYSFDVRYAAVADGAIRLAVAGEDITGDVILPATGGSTNWATARVTQNITLEAGVHSLRVHVAGAPGAYDLKSLTVNLDEVVPASGTTQHIEAETRNAESGTRLETCGDIGGGQNVAYISDGDWCRYNNLTLGTNTTFRARVARPGTPDGVIEVRLNSPTGTRVGSVPVPETGGWQQYVTVFTTLDTAEGVHDVYLVFLESDATTGSSLFNLNWFELDTPEMPPMVFPDAPTGLHAGPAGASEIHLSWNPVAGVSEYHLKRATSRTGPYEVMVIRPTETNFADTGLVDGTRYFYLVSAVLDGTEGDDSGGVFAVPSAPIDPEDVVIGSASISDGGGGTSLTFSVSVPVSGLGHGYQVRASVSLTDPDWQVVTGVLPGNGGELPINIPIDPLQSNLFYMLEAWRQ